MHQNSETMTTISHPALTVNSPKGEAYIIRAGLWRRYSTFNGLPKPTDSCQLSKSEARRRGSDVLVKMPPRFSSPLIRVNDTHSQAIYQGLFDPGQGY